MSYLEWISHSLINNDHQRMKAHEQGNKKHYKRLTRAYDDLTDEYFRIKNIYEQKQ